MQKKYEIMIKNAERRMRRRAATELNHYTNYDGKLSFEKYSSRSKDLGLTLYGNGYEIGYIRGQVLDYDNYESLQKVQTCYKDVLKLAKKGGASVCEVNKGGSQCYLPRVFMITDVNLDSYDSNGQKLRQLGLGKLLYEALFTELHKARGDFIAVPMHCIFEGNTSTDAQRVWRSLARTLESSNEIVLVDYEIIF